MSDSKEARHVALLALLEEKAVFSQKSICDEMTALGFQVTQPSISRDLNELGIVKLSGRYLPPTTLSEHLPESLTMSVQAAGPHLVVVRTKIGAAQAVAVKIDDIEVEGVVGCVAGDDTIFIALEDSKFQKTAINSLSQSLMNT